MKSEIIIPPKSYFKKAREILFGKNIDLINKKYDFNHVRKAIFNSPDFCRLLCSIGINKFYEISAGTSDRKAYPGYLNQAVNDLRRAGYYRDYTPAKGNLLARKSVAIYESLKLKNVDRYFAEDICFTEGATGAITSVFEYFKEKYPDNEVLIATPNYYIYKLAAKFFNLKFKEVIPLANKNSLKSFISVKSLIKNISNNTKLIIITNPANPSGEIYSFDGLKQLLMIAKEKQILVLVDELFSELVFDNQGYFPADQVASKINSLENLIIVKGYSKGKNLAAFRIGYLFSKNKDLINRIEKISEERQCFPVASNFAGLISLDSFIQSVNWLIDNQRQDDLFKIISKVKAEFKDNPSIQERSVQSLLNEYLTFKNYRQKLMKFYSERFDEALDILKENIIISMPKQSAFNTFVKLKDLDNINFFDFLFNLFIVTSVKIEIGPGFGFDQKTWQENPNLGFWLRLTFARDRINFIQGLKKFQSFKKVYLNNQEKFIKTGLYF